jgi:hypothetical protein
MTNRLSDSYDHSDARRPLTPAPPLAAVELTYVVQDCAPWPTLSRGERVVSGSFLGVSDSRTCDVQPASLRDAKFCFLRSGGVRAASSCATTKAGREALDHRLFSSTASGVVLKLCIVFAMWTRITRELIHAVFTEIGVHMTGTVQRMTTPEAVEENSRWSSASGDAGVFAKNVAARKPPENRAKENRTLKGCEAFLPSIRCMISYPCRERPLS